MPLQENGPAPYTTVQAAITAIEAYRERPIVGSFTTDSLIRAGVMETLANRTLSSLKLLELLNDTGEPTQQFRDLQLARGEEEYHARLQEWVRGVYAEVLQYTDPTVDSPDRVQEAFRTYQPAGQRKAMASLLIGLWKHAGLSVPEGNGSQRAPRSPRRTIRAGSRVGKPKVTQTSQPNTGNLPTGLVGLLQQIPRDGGTWTTVQRERFLTAFNAVLDYTIPLDDDPQTGVEPEDEA